MGFHPDAWASFYLSHLPGYLGEFLALTGEKLNGAELVACGIATHYSLSGVCKRLGQLMTDDPSIISGSLAQYGDLVYVDKTSVLHNPFVFLFMVGKGKTNIDKFTWVVALAKQRVDEYIYTKMMQKTCNCPKNDRIDIEALEEKDNYRDEEVMKEEEEEEYTFRDTEVL
ncbi:3-hydroxyisobutyryl-CoA hydrolase-like protein 2, mitochondrial [Lactuca sativa]|uniref:3-hydroxyisobutyryl-CoA hydrolase-like protein 2, mitochondrial n=1 Tax=Lactuca sativa TaxID=4236 RepID=UPI0022B00B1F|nr:3-hydroxyisobutyryl-CoA hydrolase-like protein 2, mitochondrial [Lactuca sativa]